MAERDELSRYAAELVNVWDRDGRRLTELARRMGVTSGYLSQLRQQQTGIGIKGAFGLAEAVGVTVDELRNRALSWVQSGCPTLDGAVLIASGRPALTADALPPKGER